MPEHDTPTRHRVLLVGDHCVSTDVAWKLNRAGVVTVRVPDHAAGLAAVAAVAFDLVLFDAEEMGAKQIGSAHEAFRRRGAKAVAVVCAADAQYGGGERWTRVERPASREAILGLLEPA